MSEMSLLRQRMRDDHPDARAEVLARAPQEVSPAAERSLRRWWTQQEPAAPGTPDAA